MFGVQNLDNRESNFIDKIFLEEFKPGEKSEEEARNDIVKIKDITMQIKAVDKQSVILLGKRIQHARRIFNRYGKRCFNEWAEKFLGSRRRAYKILDYTELYQALPPALKTKSQEHSFSCQRIQRPNAKRVNFIDSGENACERRGLESCGSR